GPAADLSYSTLYPGGYPLLITPAYWFSSNPSTVYHAVMVINALISALVLPLGYLACRRLGLGRQAAYGVAFVAALVPAGFFYSEYAMTDAVFVVTTLIACMGPAALPSDQPQAWASGRYLDGMIVVFFLVGAAVLLRARMRDIVVCAAVCTGLFLLAAVTVAVSIGTTVPTHGFGAGFNFAEPAVVTQNWT